MLTASCRRSRALAAAIERPKRMALLQNCKRSLTNTSGLCSNATPICAMLCYIEEKLGRPYEDCSAFLFVKKIVQELVLEWRKEIPN